jgi:signal transduction histidine kinase
MYWFSADCAPKSPRFSLMGHRGDVTAVVRPGNEALYIAGHAVVGLGAAGVLEGLESIGVGTALGELSASVAHEVRNPLTSIRMTLERIRERSSDREVAESLAVVATDLARLERIATDLLYTARPAAPDFEECDPGSVFGEVASLFTRTLQHREIRLETGPQVAPMSLTADPRQLKQVFMNLLTNAIHAVGAGGWIAVSFEAAQDSVTIRVADSGPGVPPEERERIFQPFVTLRPEGTGLGLAVARRIVEGHGGSIHCLERPEGRGALFEVRLPRQPAAG